jgi:peptide/nickel transport system substrate-binding protein
MKRKLLVLPALLGTFAPVLAGCGDSGTGNSGGKAIVIGSTASIAVTKDTPAPLDPAMSYDSDTWNIFFNTFQMLLRYPRSGTTPEPDAARSCGFTDKQSETYRCKLRSGLHFANGHSLNAEAVKYSVDRMIKIQSDTGPASLMSGVQKVETSGDDEVIFHLKSPDATFPFKLATPAAAIVDPAVYPADKAYTGLKIVSSGPYKLDSFNSDKAVFSANTAYHGDVNRKNSKIEMKFFNDSDLMEKALAAGTIDVVAGSGVMKPSQITDLENNKVKGVTLSEASGTETRYLFFNTADPAVKPKAVRVAIAQILDRAALVRDVFQRTKEPLYSVVPQGITGHNNAFYNLYGEADPAAAAKTLQNAGITTPVKFTYSYRTSAGAAANEEAVWLQKSLNNTGLFDVSIKKVAYSSFVADALAGKFTAYGLGWIPDFPDPDNYIAPFFSDNFLKLPYENSVIKTSLLPSTRKKAGRSNTSGDFGKMQNLIAQDVPLIPLWQSKQYIANRDDVTGVEWTLNSTSTIQFWELGKGVTN